jgi:hypothetical protein
MHFRAIGLSAAILLSCAISALGATYSQEQVRHDLRFLYETLQASHYDLFARVSRETYDREYQRAHDVIDRPLDELGSYRILQPFAALAGMAHCNIGLPFNAAYVPYVMDGGTVIPFDLTFVGHEAFIWHNYSGHAGLAPGTPIELIDGKPVAEVLDAIGRFVSGDSPYMKRTNIEMTGFPRLHWLAMGEAKKYALTLRKPDGSVLVLEVDAVPALQFEQKAAANRPVTNPSRELRFIGRTAYLRPGVFLNNQSPGDLTAHATFEKGEYIQFLEASFREIRAKDPGSMIIDLRGNPGGDNSFSDPMIAWFAERAFRFCSRFDVKTSQVTKNFWEGVTDPKLADLKHEILAHENGQRFQADIPHVEPRAESERYRRQVFVLVDRFSYSNATVVAAMIQDYKFGIIVGEVTADVPSTYGAAHQFNLPNTQLTVMYPKALMIRPSGEISAEGVRPDHEIADNVFTERDEILQEALNLTLPSRAQSAVPEAGR